MTNKTLAFALSADLDYAIDCLRTCALDYRIDVAHLCTAALDGEQWASDRIQAALGSVRDPAKMTDASLRALILGIDTTRPDGARARSFSL